MLFLLVNDTTYSQLSYYFCAFQYVYKCTVGERAISD